MLAAYFPLQAWEYHLTKNSRSLNYYRWIWRITVVSTTMEELSLAAQVFYNIYMSLVHPVHLRVLE